MVSEGTFKFNVARIHERRRDRRKNASRAFREYGEQLAAQRPKKRGPTKKSKAPAARPKHIRTLVYLGRYVLTNT